MTKLEPQNCPLQYAFYIACLRKIRRWPYALRFYRPQSVPAHRRSREHHAWGGPFKPGLGRGVHPHPKDGTGIWHAFAGPWPGWRQTDPSRPYTTATRAWDTGPD